jgi:processive 1,2-diacylglycerol beta-glucosyltransferase
MNAMRREKILILYGNYGEGHRQAALAIQESMQIHHPNLEPVLLDYMALCHPYSNRVSKYLFLQGMKNFPVAYGYLFRKTKHSSNFIPMFDRFNRLGLGRLLSVLRELRPSAVISTFPLAAGAISTLKAYGEIRVPAITVITDHTSHSYWVHAYTDHYLVGSDEVKNGLRQFEVPSEKVTVTGIPIRLAFSDSYDRHAIQSKHQLDPSLPTVLLMGGGYGLFGEDIDYYQALEASSKQLQLLIICGHNYKIIKQVTEKFRHSKHRVVIKGYVDYIHELMAVSDLMITKPGGLTVSEALAMEVPMLLSKPLPGQEEDNANYLLNHGAALLAANTTELKNNVIKACSDPDLLSNMRICAKNINKKRAVFEVMDVVMQSKRQLSSIYLTK